MTTAAAAAAPRATYARLAALPLRVEGYELTALQLAVNDDHTRLTTIVHLHGDRQDGHGEDTTYALPAQLAFRAAGPVLPLAGEWTLDSFAAHLATLDLFPSAAGNPDFLNFRRWAFESAALDLVLRQAGLSLAAALGRVSRPISFVVSPGPQDPVDTVDAHSSSTPQIQLLASIFHPHAPNASRPAPSTSRYCDAGCRPARCGARRRTAASGSRRTISAPARATVS